MSDHRDRNQDHAEQALRARLAGRGQARPAARVRAQVLLAAKATAAQQSPQPSEKGASPRQPAAGWIAAGALAAGLLLAMVATPPEQARQSVRPAADPVQLATLAETQSALQQLEQRLAVLSAVPEQPKARSQEPRRTRNLLNRAERLRGRLSITLDLGGNPS